MTTAVPRTYVMDHCFGTPAGEIDARVHYTLSGDPRDRDLEIDVTLIEVEGEVADPSLYELVLDIGTEPFLTNAFESEAEFRNDAGDARHEAARERRGE